jgi:hypothetical protein
VSSGKISVTIAEGDLSWLRRRAKRLHGGNLSAAIVEATRTLRRQEALQAFLEDEGVPRLEPAELAEITSEWAVPAAAARKRRRTA